MFTYLSTNVDKFNDISSYMKGKKSLILVLCTSTLFLAGCGDVDFNDSGANVGGNESFSNEQKFRKQHSYFKPEPKPKEEPAPPKKEADHPVLDAQGHDIRSIDKISEEVIEGKYANGDERRKLLGNRYKAVQDAVNEKCINRKDPRCSNFR